MAREGFYAVRQGRQPGIYRTWPECQANVQGFRGAVFKKFNTYEEAQEFCNPGSGSVQYANSPSPQTRNYVRYDGFTQSNRYDYDDYEDDDICTEHHYRGGNTSIVYTDGASSNNGYGNARAGYGVYWGENHPRNMSAPLSGPRQTNQRAEAQAVICALEQSLNDHEPLEIRTDSQYVINAVTSWSKNWIRNGWRTSSGKEVENRDLFERILRLIDTKRGEVKFSYVPGHSGEFGNERADQLAVAGAQRQYY